MKIIVLSDVHGNIPALQVVLDEVERRRPDMLVVNGDLINRGPYSLQAMQLLQAAQPGAICLRGNHENFTVQAGQHELDRSSHLYPLQQFAWWTAEQMGIHALQEVANWDEQLDVSELEGGSSFHITHGSVRGDRDGISVLTREEDLPAKLGSPRDLFVASHTHKAMTRLYQGRIVVNTGSVGQPMDEDERAAFAEFTYQHGYWSIEPIRLAYDKQRACSDFRDSGFLAQAGPMALLIYCEHRLNRPFVGPMMHKYYAAIESGRLSFNRALSLYLRESGLEKMLPAWQKELGDYSLS